MLPGLNGSWGCGESWTGWRVSGSRELAGVDARGAAGAECDQQIGSTAAWLRSRLRLGAGTASIAVRTVRALFRGPLTQTAQALCDGELSTARAAVVAHGTKELPDHTPPRPTQGWSTPAGDWTRPGCDDSSAICGRSSTPTAPTRPPSAAMRAAACG